MRAWLAMRAVASAADSAVSSSRPLRRRPARCPPLPCGRSQPPARACPERRRPPCCPPRAWRHRSASRRPRAIRTRRGQGSRGREGRAGSRSSWSSPARGGDGDRASERHTQARLGPDALQRTCPAGLRAALHAETATGGLRMTARGGDRPRRGRLSGARLRLGSAYDATRATIRESSRPLRAPALGTSGTAKAHTWCNRRRRRSLRSPRPPVALARPAADRRASCDRRSRGSAPPGRATTRPRAAAPRHLTDLEATRRDVRTDRRDELPLAADQAPQCLHAGARHVEHRALPSAVDCRDRAAPQVADQHRHAVRRAHPQPTPGVDESVTSPIDRATSSQSSSPVSTRASTPMDLAHEKRLPVRCRGAMLRDVGSPSWPPGVPSGRDEVQAVPRGRAHASASRENAWAKLRPTTARL